MLHITCGQIKVNKRHLSKESTVHRDTYQRHYISDNQVLYVRRNGLSSIRIVYICQNVVNVPFMNLL